MEPIDISVLLREGTPEWPGDTPYTCGWTWRIAEGASVNLSAVHGSPHVGTHADAPLHVRDGWPASHELPVEAFVGACVVCDVTAAAAAIEFDDLRLPHGDDRPARLLLRTNHSIASGTFPGSWPVLSEACVRLLLRNGLRLLGVDAPSVDTRESTTLAVHRQLFEHGAFILENLDLRRVPAGAYELLAAPLLLEGLDAAPVRALLRPLPTA